MYDHAWKALIIVVALFAFCGIMLFECDEANAESAIVSFDNAEHLAALTDSVVGVCDTVKWRWEPCYLRADSCVIKGNHVFAYYPDSYTLILPGGNDSCKIQVYPPLITCRELVCVTVMPNLRLWEQMLNPSRIRMRPTPWQAIIDYEEVRR